MSREFVVLYYSDPPLPFGRMPSNWRSRPLGPADAVRGLISGGLGDVDWSDPRSGRLEDGDVAIEFDLGNADPLGSLRIRVRGSSPRMQLLLGLIEKAGWFLVDVSANEWVHHLPADGLDWPGLAEYQERVNWRLRATPAHIERLLGLRLPESHLRALANDEDPIHDCTDFLLLESDNVKMRLLDTNRFLHDLAGWRPWPQYLVAFASNGCGDYYAYDLRDARLSIIYIDPDNTPEENLKADDKLQFASFDEWYRWELESR